MSRKRKGSMPVVMKRKDDNVVMKLSSLEATRLNKPYMGVPFKTGGHRTSKDRPRDNNWRKSITRHL